VLILIGSSSKFSGAAANFNNSLRRASLDFPAEAVVTTKCARRLLLTHPGSLIRHWAIFMVQPQVQLSDRIVWSAISRWELVKPVRSTPGSVVAVSQPV
jgi:hypothetical protein